MRRCGCYLPGFPFLSFLFCRQSETPTAVKRTSAKDTKEREGGVRVCCVGVSRLPAETSDSQLEVERENLC